MAKSKVINTVLRLRDDMSGGLLKAARNTKAVSKEMQNATRKVVAFKNKAVSSVTSAAKTFGKLTAAAATATAALAVKTGLSEALDLEGYRTQLVTATKDTERASEVMQYAIKLANATPFEGGELVSAASALEMFGLKTERWLPVLGDAAAGVNRSMDEVQQGFIKAVTTGEFESLKDTLSVTKDMVDDFAKQKFGKSFLNTQGQVTDTRLLQDALEGLLNERFGGGMERLAKTTKGLWSTVTGVTKNSLAKILGMQDDGTIKAGSALDWLKGKVELLANKLQAWQADGTIDRLSDKLTQGLAWACDKASQAFAWLREHGDTVARVLKTLAAAFALVKVAQFANGVIKAVKTVGLFAKTVGVLVATNPVVLVIGAIIAVGALLIANWDKVKAAAQKLWAKVKDIFGKIKTWIVDKFKAVIDMVTRVKDFFVGGFLTAINAVKDAFEWVKDTVGRVIDKIKEFLGLDTKKTVEVNYQVNENGRASGGFSGDDNGRVTGGNGNAGGRSGRNALGTSYWRGGPTRVNERGGEIMNLPSGTQIIPHDISRRMTGGTNVNVSVQIDGNVIGNKAFADEVGERVFRKVLLALDNV